MTLLVHPIQTLVTGIALLGVPLDAQQSAASPADTLRPGDPRVDARHIVPHTNHWSITYQTPDGHVVPGGPSRVASWFDTVTIDKLDGRAALHRRQVLRVASGAVMEIIDTWIDRRTFAPIETRSYYPAQRTESLRRYAGVHVTGFDPDSTAPNGRKLVDTVLAEPVFDFFGGSYDLLLSAFPLRAGFRAVFPADLGGATGGVALTWVAVTVTGKEEVDGGSIGRVSAWHVVTDSTSLGRFEFWIAEKSPYMIRMMYIGPRGGRQIWNVAAPA